MHRDRIEDFRRAALAGSEGLPVGVQVASLPNRDELCLHVMECIERAMGFHEMSSLSLLY